MLPLASMVAVFLGQLVESCLVPFPKYWRKLSSLLTCTYNCISACRIHNAILTLLMLRKGNATREESKIQDKFWFFSFSPWCMLQTRLGNLREILADHLKINQGQTEVFS